MPVSQDYSREAWSRRKGESNEEERTPRRYHYWDSPHGPKPKGRWVNYLFIFFGLSVAAMFGLVLLMLYSLATFVPI